MSLTPKKTNGASQMTKHIMKLMVKYETWVVLRKRSILQEVLKNIRYAEKYSRIAILLEEHGMSLHENASRSFKNVLKWSD